MNSYGPPQVFKIVSKIDGKLFWDIDLNDQKKDDWTGVKNNCEALQNYEPETEALMQSTGYKDKTGADVFFGDKLVSSEGVIWTAEYISDGDPAVALCFKPLQMLQSILNAQHMQIIGNIHTPHDELMMAAEGVRDGKE
jgi:hypothetical protein